MKRSPLILALLLSLLLHLGLLSSGVLPSFAPVQDSKLQPIKMQLTPMELGSAPAAPKPVAVKPDKGTQIATLPSRVRAATVAPKKADASVAAANQQQIASAPHAEASASAPQTEAEAPAGDNQPRNGYLVARSHRKRFPTKVSLRYQVYYGALMAGLATIHWEHAAGHYRLETTITPIFGPQLRYQSEGEISPAGLKPDSYTAWRNDTPRERAHFDWDNQRLNYGDDGNQSVALQAGAQDILSLIYQLALKGASHPPVQITTGKKVYQYPLAPSGEADFDTGAGKIHALVFRAEGDGDRTEFWLARDFANQPIRIIRTDSKMKLDMRVTDISINDAAEWHLPKPTLRKHDK